MKIFTRTDLPLFQTLIKKRYEVILFGLVILYSVVWSALTTLRHAVFLTHLDLASYEQTYWNTIHGHILESSSTLCTFPFDTMMSGIDNLPTMITPYIFDVQHINLIELLFAPIYALLPFTNTLLISQSIILASGAIPIYFISKKELGNRPISLIICASYLLSPALQGTNILDYNPAVFSLPLLLSAFYFCRTENWKLYWVFIGLSLLTREEVSLFVLFLGIFIFFFQKKRKIGLISMIVGLTWFIVTFYIILPSLIGTQQFNGLLSNVSQGQGLLGIPKTLITHPEIIYNHVATQGVGIYLFQIFSHTAFLSFLSPTGFIMSIPTLMTNLLANSDAFRLMWNHYPMLLIPGVFVSTIFSLRKIMNTFNSHKNLIILLLCITLLFFAIVSNSFYSAAPLKEMGATFSNGTIKSEPRFVWWEFLNFDCCINYSVTNPVYKNKYDQIESANVALSMIPDYVSVATQDNFISHLSKRSDLYLFPIYYDKVDYVLVMEKPYGMFDTGYLPQQLQDKYVNLLENDHKHKIIFHENNLLLFKKIK